MLKFKFSPCPVQKKSRLLTRAVYLPLSADIRGKLGIFRVWNVTNALTCQFCSGDKTILKKCKPSNVFVFNLYFVILGFFMYFHFSSNFQEKIMSSQKAATSEIRKSQQLKERALLCDVFSFAFRPRSLKQCGTSLDSLVLLIKTQYKLYPILRFFCIRADWAIWQL